MRRKQRCDRGKRDLILRYGTLLPSDVRQMQNPTGKAPPVDASDKGRLRNRLDHTGLPRLCDPNNRSCPELDYLERPRKCPSKPYHPDKFGKKTVQQHTSFFKFLIVNAPSSRPHHQVHTAIRADYVANLAYLQSVRCLLERLLHLSGAKPAQVATLLMGGAIRVA